MNAQLLNPFTIDIPDSVSATLESAECTTLLFNHGSNTLSGQYLAVGRSDGYITIWDIETKSVLRLLTGHVRPVTGLAWSEGNRYLASGSADWSVIIWDLKAKSGIGSGLRAREKKRAGEGGEKAGLEGEDTRLPFGSERKKTLRFDCSVVSVQFAPGDSRRLVVVLASQQAFLVDIRDRVRIRKRRAESPIEVEEVVSSPTRTPLLSNSITTEESSEGEPSTTSSTSGITAARFTPDSRFIVAGTSKGSLLIFSSLTGVLLSESKVLSTSSGVKELSFDAACRFLVVNCNDRSLRLLSLSLTPSDPTPTLTLTLQNKVQDMVQRTAWSTLGFSPSSDYIFAGAAHKASHNIYIWDRPSATLTKILEGPKDWLISVDWHPNRPMLASVGNTGAIYIWFTPTEEIWSAYAPGFEELEENRNYDYEEREDEFDVDEGEGVREMKRQEEVEAGEVRVGAGSGGRRGAVGIGAEGEGEKWDGEKVWGMLEFGEGEKGRYWDALEMVCTQVDGLVSDSGWVGGEEKEVGEVREMVFALADDDTEETFVIPPRLETDFSEFHDEHI
ncbi:related to SWD1 - subunit of the COMPASS complex [Ustilago sp. UG-2017a]|nr:related to SWD1 - subunit of the COMPASS complex [Ustilago sp. UG-2017a]